MVNAAVRGVTFGKLNETELQDCSSVSFNIRNPPHELCCINFCCDTCSYLKIEQRSFPLGQDEQHREVLRRTYDLLRHLPPLSFRDRHFAATVAPLRHFATHNLLRHCRSVADRRRTTNHPLRSLCKEWFKK